GHARGQRAAVRHLSVLALARLARRAAGRVTEARFPPLAPDRGPCGSFSRRAVDPERPRGAWIRHTTHQRPGQAPTGSVWCTYSDAEAGAPYAVKQTLPGPVADPAGWIAIARSAFGPDGARGRAEAEGRSA